MKSFREFRQAGVSPATPKISESEDYRDEHQAPTKGEGNAPMHDVTGVYPSDFYSHNGFKYYSDQGSNYDRESHDKIVSKRNAPNGTIEIHRAVPKGIKTNGIKPGDWVTHNKKYAHEHGKAHLNGNYKIMSKVVHPRDLFTDGNSVHEWGYDPQPYDKASEDAKRARIAAKKEVSEKYILPAIKQHFSHYRKEIEKNSKTPSEKIKAHATHLGVMGAIGTAAGLEPAQP